MTFREKKKKRRMSDDEQKERQDPGLKVTYLNSRIKEGVSTHPRFVRADRTMLNMLEQMPPFLASMWMVSPAALRVHCFPC